MCLNVPFISTLLSIYILALSLHVISHILMNCLVCVRKDISTKNAKTEKFQVQQEPVIIITRACLIARAIGKLSKSTGAFWEPTGGCL